MTDVHSIVKDDDSITYRQQSVLDSLVCEHVSCSDNNIAILRKFKNDKNGALLKHLQEDDVKADAEGSSALYIVKTHDGIGLLAFCIKCSELFEQLSCPVKDFEHVLMSEFWEQLSTWPEPSSKSRREFSKRIMQVIDSHFTKKNFASFNKIDQRVIDDWRRSKTKKHILSENTFSSIQLVDICKNESVESLAWWQNACSQTLGDKKIGRVLFWWFVAPIVMKMKQHAGCEYFTLFAADISDIIHNERSRDKMYGMVESLIDYYKSDLNFSDELNYVANKPHYDVNCHLMCQRIDEMEECRIQYLNSFNNKYFVYCPKMRKD